MIKDILDKNETVTANEREISILKEHFPACFSEDGSFDVERFREYISDKVDVRSEGYELKFLGKNYARLLASIDTTTVIVPDDEHNEKPENKDSENLYITGDNLDGLKHLLKSYAGKIKCIYIDPPYNTGSDGFVYSDRFDFTVDDLTTKLSISESEAQRILDLTKRSSASHSAWLMFMYPRLQLARDLLTDDGVIFISIDDNEQANLKLLCDDVFGEENHLVSIARRTKSGGGSASDAFAVEHDYICVYCRNINELGKLSIPFSLEYLDRYSEEDKNGRFFWDTMERSSTKTKPYTILAPDGSKLEGKWFRSKDRFLNDLEKGEVRFLQKNDGTFSVQFKQRLADGKKMRSLLYEKEYKSYSDDLKELGLEGTFLYPKTVYLIQYLLQLIKGNEIVVDFFSGSATTAHAVLHSNIHHRSKETQLKYIMIQLPEDLDQIVSLSSGDSKVAAEKSIKILDQVNRPHTLDQIGIERIIRAAKKIKEEHPDTTADLGFKHFVLEEPSGKQLGDIIDFDRNLNEIFVTNNLVEGFGTNTVLTTWLVRDGYGFSPKVNTVAFGSYTGYHMDKHLYLIDQDLDKTAIDAIIAKFDTDPAFNPENVVLFGYSFTWTEMESLQTNLKRLKATEKNLRINFDIRY